MKLRKERFVLDGKRRKQRTIEVKMEFEEGKGERRRETMMRGKRN